MNMPHPAHARLLSSPELAHRTLSLTAATGLRPELAAFFALASPPGRASSPRTARNRD
jgi:hypothetical protein